MKEKILLLPGANGTELTRMLARFHKNSLGLRIMNAAELARFGLMRSGIVPKETFLPRKQESAVIDGFLREKAYFKSAGYADAEKMADTLFAMRSLIPDQEPETVEAAMTGGSFPEKNMSILFVYDRYRRELQKTGNLDTIGLIRKAIEKAKPLSCPIYTLAEFPLTPLERALANRLTDNLEESNLPALLGLSATALRNIDFTASYGASNEIEAIYHYILSNDLPFDDCVVAVADPRYGQLFWDFAKRQDLPITLGCGVPIMNSNPAKQLKLLYDWQITGYHGVDALTALLYSESLDWAKLNKTLNLENKGQLEKVVQIAGQLRLSFDGAENRKKTEALPADEKKERYYGAVAALARELALGFSGWIEKYAKIRNGEMGRVDMSARAVICDTLEGYAKHTQRPVDAMIPQLLQRSVCTENSREGALFVTGIPGAMVSMRKHLFVAGLSAENFPGSPRENYLLLDCDYARLPNADQAPTSENLIFRKKKTLEDLLILAAALGVSTHISYSNYDTATLKYANPSSVLFDIFNQQQGGAATLEEYQKAFRKVGYFGQQVTDDYTIGKAYVDGKKITYETVDGSTEPEAHKKARKFSPSALEEFFTCPKAFFLKRILGVKEAEEDDPFTVMDAAEFGTLAHGVMEELAKSPCDKETFMKRAEAAFDRFLQARPALHTDSALAERRTFLRTMKTAYEMDPGRPVLAAEEKQEFTHKSGIVLFGYPDRVEEAGEDEYIIVDYKTGKNISHKENDIDTCLQVVIYAYLLESKGKRITGCEYRYLRLDEVVKCKYDDDMKAQLNEKMEQFKQALKDGLFPCATDEDACKYCKLADICGKEAESE